MPPLCKSNGCTTATRLINGFCKSHGGGTPCVIQNCTNIISKKNCNLCKEHGNGLTCIFGDCKTLGDPITLFCSDHIKYHRCKTVACTDPLKPNSEYCHFHARTSRCPNCRDWIDSRKGQKKYNGYCSICFKQCFPKDPRAQNIGPRTLQNKIQTFLDQHFTDFVHEAPIYTDNCDCPNRRRIDHYLPLGCTIIAIETDEHQHKDYHTDYDEIRYNDLYMHFSGKWIFIRLNVHSYMLHGKIKLTTLQERLEALKNEIEYHIIRATNDYNKELLEVHKLYYDFPCTPAQNTA
jgi:hypothetical protein